MTLIDVEAAASTPDRHRRGRKVRAVLAGGLVLGVGAAITLAAWTDSEFATGTFTAGSFNLEGSTTGAADSYVDHDTAAGAAEIDFTTGFDNLAPDTTVAAPFWIRLAAGTTSTAVLDLTEIVSTVEPAAGTNDEAITFDAYVIDPAATCSVATTSATNLAAGETLASGAIAGGTVPLSIGATETDPGEAVQICLVVSTGTEDVFEQDESVTSTWQFLATSQ